MKGGLGLCGKRDEALQQTPGQFEPDPERASRGEILVEKLLQVGHAAPPGQAGARARSASRSTFA